MTVIVDVRVVLEDHLIYIEVRRATLFPNASGALEAGPVGDWERLEPSEATTDKAGA